MRLAPRLPRPSVRRLSAAVIALASLGVTGCPNQEALGYDMVTVLGAGVINDPANRSLRFDILKFGLERFCFEMMNRGVPLKLADDQPVAGRFFADSCTSQLIDEENRKSLIVQYTGRGYGYTAATGRVGFTSSGIAEYAPDFRVKDDAMYIFFRPQSVQAASFEVTLVESSFAKAGMSVIGVDPNAVGQKLVDSQLKRGFTVVRYSEKGETELAMGIIALGSKPFKPFQIARSDKTTLENNRTEVYQHQQDYVGGFEVTDSGQALYLTVTLDGTDAADLFVIPKGLGSDLVRQYVSAPGPVSLTQAPLLDEVLTRGQTHSFYLPLPKGTYYLLIDNSTFARAQPPGHAGDNRAAKVDYLVQLGDRR